MKKILSFCMLILSVAFTFAQDGYFIKDGFGAGTSSSSFSAFPGVVRSNHGSIFSDQTQINIGYTHGNLQLETGVGYLLTGLSFVPGSGGCVAGPNPNKTPPPVSAEYITYTIKNPHLTVPLIVSTTINRGKKISFNPGIGIEALYNFKGKMTASNQGDAANEVIDYSYNNISAAILLKLDVQYRISKEFSVWCSPSYQDMITSLTTKVQGDDMSRVYDRAFLLNVGVKYNLQCSHKSAVMVNGIKS